VVDGEDEKGPGGRRRADSGPEKKKEGGVPRRLHGPSKSVRLEMQLVGNLLKLSVRVWLVLGARLVLAALERHLPEQQVPMEGNR
jgi:hypothetical protein